ncbi:Protein of unknown function [Bacillus wiedmannii]|uniref:Uncharacterized protein n=1 Tax=Bacillus wiedmannii TaxID=1890302 RepID=A0A1C4BIF1_9BACI|nr:Protein of unknown function [Bacillus mobilis]SCC02732.1 Protein of unknown function [Bacillus wiedmannii]SCC06603.1 Protein of unknown function [Bacillus wiedmannii]SCN01979.1 Protein of unknown function [Bacillus wiedmannii]SCN43345.1 Protein of unknown function [Bacillus cereus]
MFNLTKHKEIVKFE